MTTIYFLPNLELYFEALFVGMTLYDLCVLEVVIVFQVNCIL